MMQTQPQQFDPEVKICSKCKNEKPLTAHNFTKPKHEDFKRCWALKNLQPLWSKKNISKGNRLTKHFQPSLLI